MNKMKNVHLAFIYVPSSVRTKNNRVHGRGLAVGGGEGGGVLKRLGLAKYNPIVFARHFFLAR